MITLFAKYFINDYKDITNTTVRAKYGMLCGIVGIVLNILLFLLKLIAGTISKSISITADAFNNLSDAGASIITLIGFKLSNQKPDPEHPFGHGRFEYLSGFVVSITIIIMAFELLQSSFGKIIHPTDVIFQPVAILILSLSILTKLYMAYYNGKTAKLIDSKSMKATVMDSMSDSIATFLVLIVSLTSYYIHLPSYVDGICGILVALFILYSGVSTAKDTMDLLLGQSPSKEFVQQIQDIVLSNEDIISIHDLIVHDYGPGRLMITLHAEVDAEGDIMEMHDMIDNVERRLCQELSCIATIHMDPIKQHDPETQSLQLKVLKLILKIHPDLRMHDFRIVPGPTHTNILFDVDVPYHVPVSDDALKKEIEQAVSSLSERYYAIICIDRNYIS